MTSNAQEIWLPIPDAEDRYEVSSSGRVRSLDTILEVPCRWGGTRWVPIKGRVLKAWPDAGGYPTVYLANRRAVNVHRLVALTFLGESGGRQVNHIDGNKQNNCPENLEWCTRVENMAHARSAGLVNDSKPVIAVPKNGGPEIRFSSISEAVRELGATGTANIISAAKGRLETSCGYRWRYADAA